MATITPNASVISKAFNKEISLPGDTLKLMLVSSSYTPDETHAYKSDITGEITGTGYSAGGFSLTGVTFTHHPGANAWVLDAADIRANGTTLTARYGILYDATPVTDAARPILALLDFGADRVTTNSPFVVQWNDEGILRFSS